MVAIIEKLASRWCVPVGLLEDVYYWLANDARYESMKHPGGIRYGAMSRRLRYVYRVEINERQLRYLVKVVRRERRRVV